MADKVVISVVDDDPSARDGVVDLVRSMGFDAEGFESAEDFLQSSRPEITACLITDVRMPGMSGLDLHDRLIASGRPIETIVISAFPQEADRARALATGVRCYLPKPFSDQELLDCIVAGFGSIDKGT